MGQKRKAALVTGASSGIGRAISMRLCEMGYVVYGIGRSFPEEEELPESFHPVICDLLDTAKLLETVVGLRRQWKREGYRFSVLVNNAGTAYYGLHEQLSPEAISEMVRVNLEVPMVLTQQLQPLLRENRGSIFQIASVTALASNPHGAAYGATKAGLLSFSRSLFDEVRKHGVRVTTILPDLTDTGLYRHADFGTDPAMDAHLEPEDVADAVVFSLNAREGSCVPEILLRPQLHRICRKIEKLALV